MKTIHTPLVVGAVLVASPVLRAEVLPSDVAVVEDEDGSLSDMTTQAMPNVWLQKVACLFYAKYPDEFDAIFVFTTIPMSLLTNVQQGWPVKQTSKGIGRKLYSQAGQFCSKKNRLRQAVKMGDLQQLPHDPDALYTGIPMYALSGIELMAHEFGHHWLASITFQKEDGVKHCYVRGYEPMGEVQGEMCDGGVESGFNQHWSYYYNSRSVMYGSFIEDTGDGWFKLWYDNPKYSELDQYLMGLRLPEEVPPQFLVDTGDPLTGSASLPPQWNGKYITLQGKRVDFTVEDVIRSLGPREPPLEPCHWKGALILVVPKDKPPTPQQVQKVVTYGQRWESFYEWATDGRGSFDVTLDGRGAGTAGCPSPTAPPPPDATPDSAIPDRERDPGHKPDLWTAPDLGAPPETVILDVPEGTLAETETDSGWQDAGGLCTPHSLLCHPFQSVVVRCNSTGDGWREVEDCGARGLRCDQGACVAGPESGGTGGGGCVAGAWPGSGWALLALAALARVRFRRR